MKFLERSILMTVLLLAAAPPMPATAQAARAGSAVEAASQAILANPTVIKALGTKFEPPVVQDKDPALIAAGCRFSNGNPVRVGVPVNVSVPAKVSDRQDLLVQLGEHLFHDRGA